MHSNDGVNPLHPMSKKIKEITSKKKKTDEDHEQILRLKWEMGLYLAKDGKPMIPSTNVEACIRDAAKKVRRGKEIVSGLVVQPDEIPLIYTGPTDREGLWEANFVDIRIGRVDRGRVPVARPRFDNWQLKFMLEYSENDFNDDEIKQFIIEAGSKIGLCDYRPKFGRFSLVSIEPA